MHTRISEMPVSRADTHGDGDRDLQTQWYLLSLLLKSINLQVDTNISNAMIPIQHHGFILLFFLFIFITPCSDTEAPSFLNILIYLINFPPGNQSLIFIATSISHCHRYVLACVSPLFYLPQCSRPPICRWSPHLTRPHTVRVSSLSLSSLEFPHKLPWRHPRSHPAWALCSWDGGLIRVDAVLTPLALVLHARLPAPQPLTQPEYSPHPTCAPVPNKDTPPHGRLHLPASWVLKP